MKKKLENLRVEYGILECLQFQVGANSHLSGFQCIFREETDSESHTGNKHLYDQNRTASNHQTV